MSTAPDERVARLEAELAAQAAAYDRKLAEAQERLYWLDRWGLDLNELMERPWVRRAYAVAGRARHLLRRLRG